MSNAFPPGGTYFDDRKSFADVNYDTEKDNAINTTQFLEASESLTTLFDVIGGAAFKPVKSDMQGNIKVRKTPSDILQPDETGHSNNTACFLRKSQNVNSPLLSSPTLCKTLSVTSSRPASTPHPKAFSGSSGKTYHNSNSTLPTPLTPSQTEASTSPPKASATTSPNPPPSSPSLSAPPTATPSNPTTLS
jgi:hypothetical protein